MPQNRIFISYRRDDSKYPAHLLYERLITAFGPDRVFMDISDIPFGVNFRDHIREQMRDSAVCLALIGPQWLGLLQQRAEDPRDFLRIELELAHELGVKVVPVTLDEARLPGQEELPESLRPLQLSDINSQPIRGGADLKSDLDRLVAGLANLLGSDQFLNPPSAEVEPRNSHPELVSGSRQSASKWAVLSIVALLVAAAGVWWGLNPPFVDAPSEAGVSEAGQEALLTLDLNIASAEVEIDGRRQGGDGLRRNFNLEPGEYHIAVRADGYVPYEKTIELTDDRRMQIDLARLFTLTLRSNVVGDRALVDELEVGSTRVDIELPAGEHRVRIEKEGYEPFVKTLDLTGDRTLRAVLDKATNGTSGGVESDSAANAPALANSNSQPGDTFRDPMRGGGQAPPMTVVPGGRFLMGSPDGESGRRKDEDPQHWVSVSSFALGTHEVTRGDFALFVQDTGYRTLAEKSGGCEVYSEYDYEAKAGASWRDPGYFQTDEYPLVCVSHGDALAYIDWLSKETGQEYRLPSEAEWEYAARGGTQTVRWWGNDPSKACSYANVLDAEANPSLLIAYHRCNDKAAKSAPVARYPANGFRLHDMLGNVWEWTADCWHDSFAGAPNDGSAWMAADGEDCSLVVVRGGGWDSSPDFVRSAVRLGQPPDAARSARGFRLARSL